MVEEFKYLWEVLVPTISNEGKPFKTRHHRSWDSQVRRITGGLTIFAPAKGEWVSPSGTLFRERMIPVRIMATEKQIEEIADRTANHYKQLAVMYYRLSEQVKIKSYDKKKLKHEIIPTI